MDADAARELAQIDEQIAALHRRRANVMRIATRTERVSGSHQLDAVLSRLGYDPDKWFAATERNDGVYFVKAGRFVKIGFSTNVAKRLAALQTSQPHKLRLLAVVEGDLSTESALHARFAELRHQGEWFRWKDPLKNFVWSLRK